MKHLTALAILTLSALSSAQITTIGTVTATLPFDFTQTSHVLTIFARARAWPLVMRQPLKFQEWTVETDWPVEEGETPKYSLQDTHGFAPSEILIRDDPALSGPALTRSIGEQVAYKGGLLAYWRYLSPVDRALWPSPADFADAFVATYDPTFGPAVDPALVTRVLSQLGIQGPGFKWEKLPS